MNSGNTTLYIPLYGKYYVSKLSPDGVVQKRYVTVAMQGITETWILQGIEEGETIIID